MSDALIYNLRSLARFEHADLSVADEAADEIERLRAALAAAPPAPVGRDQMREALERIKTWADAYPIEVFPEPDFKRVRELLEAGGVSLDSVSASNFRHVVSGIGEIAREALASKGAG